MARLLGSNGSDEVICSDQTEGDVMKKVKMQEVFMGSLDVVGTTRPSSVFSCGRLFHNKMKNGVVVKS